MARYQNPSGKLHGFLLSGGVYTTLDDPFVGTIGTVARGINDMGEIVGYFANASGTHACTFDSMKMKSDGMTPTTVCGTPSMRRLRPSAWSAPNSRRRSGSPRITT